MKNRSSVSSVDSNVTASSTKSRRTIKTARSSEEMGEGQGSQMSQAAGGNMMVSTTSQTIVQAAGWSGGLTKEWLMTDLIFIRHPRTILILVAIKLCLGTKIGVFGLICRFYEGCPYAAGVWIGCLFVANSVFGFIFLKFKPKRLFLILYCFASIICLLLATFLFALTAWLLDNEEYLMRKKGWDFIRQRAYDLNRIIENTKLAMFILHMVLAPIYGVCCIGTIIILCQNLAAPSSEEFQGYYISDAPCGHQTVLVPVALKTGVKSSPIYTRERSPPRIFVNNRTADKQPFGQLRSLISTGTQTTVTGRYM